MQARSYFIFMTAERERVPAGLDRMQNAGQNNKREMKRNETFRLGASALRRCCYAT